MKIQNKIKINKKEFITAGLSYAAVFIISLVSGLLMFKKLKIAPFGDESVLCMDLWGQYAPMYAQLMQIDSLADMIHSWNGVFGFNNLAMNAYYCNSIFWIPLLIIPMKNLVSYINYVCLVKYAFAGVSCLAFLRYKLKSRSVILIGGSAAYGLCAYMLAYMSQPMWTDCLILVPFVLIGLERLMNRKKYLMYIVFLSLTIISNFYIGISVCIFCVLYFLANVFLENEENVPWKKDKFGKAVRFALSSAAAGAIASPFILTAYSAVSQSMQTASEKPEMFRFFANIASVFRCMLSGEPLYVEYTGVNISVGMIAFVMLPLYFFNSNIKGSKRAANGVFLSFLALSCCDDMLNFVWHGLHYPNQLPGRWTFLFSLLVVELICSAAINLRELPMSRVILSILTGLSAVFIGVRGIGKDMEEISLPKIWLKIFIAESILVLLIILADMASKKYEENKTVKRVSEIALAVFVVLLTGTIAFNSAKNLIDTASQEKNGTRTSDGKYYSETAVRQYESSRKWKCPTSTFYRVLPNGGFTFNPSMFGDMQGISYYSSTMKGSTFSLLKYLGNRVYADRLSSCYNLDSPVQDSLFGVRYFIDYSRSLSNQFDFYRLVESNDNCDIVENTNALSLSFPVSDKIMSFEPTDEVRTLRNQNLFLSALCGEETNVFKTISPSSLTSENAGFIESNNWNSNYYTLNEGCSDLSIHYEFVCPYSGTYFMDQNFRAGELKISSGENYNRNIDIGAVKFAYVGYFNAGTVVNMDYTVSNINIGCTGIDFAYFDEEVWKNTYEKLSAHQLKVDKFKNTYVRGTIELDESSVLMGTMTQDGGWSAYVDGKKCDTQTAAGEFVSVIVPAGTHTVEYRYRAPGFAVGLLIAGACIVILIFSRKISVFFISLKKEKPAVSSAVSGTKENAAESEDADQENCE